VTARAAFLVTEVSNGKAKSYSMVCDPLSLPQLAKALAGGGHAVNGYSVEALLIRLSEVGEPAWATELDFDAEASACTVHCPRLEPLVLLARRLDTRLAEPARLRKLVRSLPMD
jgi:hypothetical protein